MEEKINVKEEKKVSFKEKYGVDFRSFWILVRMLLQDKLKISFKANKKQSIIKVVSLVLGFVALTALSYIFYYVVQLLHLFSVLSYIPLTVPSLISSVLLILGFLGVIFGLNRTLYYSNDNRLMITYPCNGNTIYLARIFVYFINEYIRNVVIQVPLFLGYMLVMGFNPFMVLWLLLGFAFITLVEVLLGALLSIPTYYVSRFLNRNSIIKTIVFLVIFAAIITGISILVYIIPEEIDIFTNWGPYFTKIQSFLNGYRRFFPPFYSLTIALIGDLNGFNIRGFTFDTLYVYLAFIGLIGLTFTLSIFIVNPIYFKLASESFEFENDGTFSSKNTNKRSYIHSQLHKETLLFVKDSSYLTSIIGTFIFLPIVLSLLNKIFGAMNVNAFGERIVAVVNVLIILVVSLNSNSVVAKSYSSEGNAFNYNRVYPKKSFFMLLSKNVVPFIIGTISIIVSSVLFGMLKDVGTLQIILMIVSIELIYAGHMLYSSQLDFTSLTSQFMSQTSQSKAQLASTILAFVLPLIIVVLFFLYLSDHLVYAYVKLLVLGLIVFGVCLWNYYYKVKLIYKEGK